MICIEPRPDLTLEQVACTSSSLRVYTQAEVKELVSSPWDLTVSQGASIGMAIVLVWATAFGWRAISSTLKHGNSPD